MNIETEKLSLMLSKDLAYNDHQKTLFHKQTKKVLKLLASKLGLDKAEFTIHSEKGCSGDSGEITLHAENIYIKVSQHWLGDVKSVMFRGCESQKEYSDGMENFAVAKELLSFHVVDKMTSLMNKKKLLKEASE